ncbi:hypothetical protein RSOL_384390 [Rhizoctonia solani AG-3 Rhs1AP]|uniref:Uncharacterized protein n=1 Tax=Rhizoctonia solani AG-3 Rhs1AP TaxID=1086054 RepID=X8JBW3_9AGAM|nr:hypothetical protein RSOL_384390 [Rhizoctonia solani AG-3 Rhs1AP]
MRPTEHNLLHLRCFVASSEGERFEVIWWPEDPDAIPDKYRRLDLRATVYIDGVLVEQRVLKACEWHKGQHGWMEGQQVDKYSARHFRWGQRELLDGNPEASIDLNQDLNTIRVVVEWGTAPPGGRSRQARIAPRKWNPVKARLSETKLGNTSAVVLEDPAPFVNGTPDRPLFRRVPESKLPSLTFTFRYASEDWMAASGIKLYDNPTKGRILKEKLTDKFGRRT